MSRYSFRNRAATFAVLFLLTFAVGAAYGQDKVKVDRARPAAAPKLEGARKPDNSALRAVSLNYITCDGAWNLALAGGTGIYEYASVCYFTQWTYLGEDDYYFYFKENGYTFYGAFGRTAMSNGKYAVWTSVDGSNWDYFGDAKVCEPVP